MKKLTSVLLVLIMVLAMSVSAFAGSVIVKETLPNDDTEIPVGITFVDGKKDTTIYNVEITWEQLTFTFTNGDEKVWNPESHTYSDTTADGWSEAKTITVNNHSNAEVYAKVVFAENNDLSYTNDATVTITCNMAIDGDKKITLKNAAEEAPGAPSGNPGHTLATFTLTPSGEANATNADFGTVVVEISAVPVTP